MALHRRNPRRDSSEGPIVEALERFGFTVVRLSIPDGPDLLVGRQGVSRPVEVKTGNEPLRPGQRRWWAAWKGSGCIVLRTVEDVTRLAKYWAMHDPVFSRFVCENAKHTLS